MAKRLAAYEPFELDIVGSTAFGRYPKISIEQTFNMIISDGWLVDFAGYVNVNSISSGEKGRGLYRSIRYNNLIAVIGDSVYAINTSISATFIGKIDSSIGDVFITENQANQIAICDKSSIYIFDYIDNTFQKATLDFIPGYIEFQDGYFIAPDITNATLASTWRLSALNNGLSWPNTSNTVGTFQTKADNALACIAFPGKGSLLLVMGSIVTQQWYNAGLQLFPYKLATSSNSDYGTLNAASIATSEDFAVWVAGNRDSGPSIMYSNGVSIQRISNDGIDYKLESLLHPELCSGFLFRQDGHLLYQVTWYHKSDNLTLLYDFNTKKFFTLTDPFMNFHIAKKVQYFNGDYYFISFNDGNLYKFNSNITTADGLEIPRIRICKNKRLIDASPYILNNMAFTIEQGVDSAPGRIDCSISVDGGYNFSSYVAQELNTIGHYKNRIVTWVQTYTNDFVPQFRFFGMSRFVVSDGVASYYQ